MDTFIVRQPIMSNTKKLFAYEVVYLQDSSSLYNADDAHAAESVISFFNQPGEDDFLFGRTAFLTFTPNLLMKNIPHLFDKDKVVIQVEDSILVYEEARKILASFKELGFKIALMDFEFARRFLDVIPLIDYIKVNFDCEDQNDLNQKITLAKQLKIPTIAFNVNTSEALALAIEHGFDYFQGTNVAEMVRTKTHNPKHLQSNFFRLLAAVSKEEADFDEIAEILSIDVTLTLHVLRIVNSAYFALPNRIKDVKQALTVLGLKQLKNWIYLLSFKNDGGISDELIKLSFLRGTFCQEVASKVPSAGLTASEGYMLGLFSTLDALLEVSLKEALAPLPISEEIKAALTGESNTCSDLINLCICYETGQWTSASVFARRLNISMNEIADIYYGAVSHVGNIWRALGSASAAK